MWCWIKISRLWDIWSSFFEFKKTIKIHSPDSVIQNDTNPIAATKGTLSQEPFNSILFLFGSSKGRWTVRGQSEEGGCSQAGVGAEICGDIKETVRVAFQKWQTWMVQSQLATL